MPTTSEHGDTFPRPAKRRELTVKAWLSAVSVAGLLALACWAFAAGQVLFAVALVVFAVFAAVELASTLRRRR